MLQILLINGNISSTNHVSVQFSSGFASLEIKEYVCIASEVLDVNVMMLSNDNLFYIPIKDDLSDIIHEILKERNPL